LEIGDLPAWVVVENALQYRLYYQMRALEMEEAGQVSRMAAVTLFEKAAELERSNIQYARHVSRLQSGLISDLKQNGDFGEALRSRE